MKGLLRKIQSGCNPADTGAKSILSKRTTRGRPLSARSIYERFNDTEETDERDNEIRLDTKAIPFTDGLAFAK